MTASGADERGAETRRGADRCRLDAFHDQCDEFERAWQLGQPPPLAVQLSEWTEPLRSELLRELLIIELRYRQQRGEQPSADEYFAGLPNDRSLIARVFSEMERSAARFTTKALPAGAPPAFAPPADPSPQADAGDSIVSSRVGRYAIERLLGAGGFGRVFLAYDEQLQRRVALKMPRPERLSTAEAVEIYLDEARTVAGLRHPAIAPVFDVGQTDDGHCYVVSQYIDGTNLAERVRHGRLTQREASLLVATIAEALHYAHSRKIVHRDVKPANILVDTSGSPFLTDFGLALREARYGKDGAFAGTPAYMSPEQARGEGHLVDGRSDIFSLGIVYYELLTGERPFVGETASEILERTLHLEARPPRQLDSSIRRDRERICLKCLEKRATDRYPTALDLARELRATVSDGTESSIDGRLSSSQRDREAETPPIVPKGLRSFDAEDADFFIQLLPGVRDRDGLPESIRFWKARIEELDEDHTFRVGFIYGPSGSGKSSFVKAGLLPRVAGHVQVAFVDCHAGETERRLATRLLRLHPELPAELPLDDALNWCRTEGYRRSGRKTFVVLDQFEQWLHRNEIAPRQPLIRALRQCDGAHLQCLILVRDDFWLGVHRLSQQLEVELSLGTNLAVIDLLDEAHASKVLMAFGRAFGRLPHDSLSAEQQQMIDRAIHDLSNGGRIAPIRLALFAEMIKHRPWTPETLESVGGVAGVGVAFLHENLDASTAPSIRPHRHAARDVLRSLLPDSQSSLRGPIRSQSELMAACKYTDEPRRFAELMRVLDGELRLLTPTEMESDPLQPAPHDEEVRSNGAAYYQLTHDFLVPAIREWLVEKQRRTWRGRAELALEERTRAWTVRPEPRQLPTFAEWIAISSLVRRHRRSDAQRRLLQATARHYAWRIAAGAALAMAALFAAWTAAGYLGGQRLVRELQIAQFGQVPEIVRRMERRPFWTRRPLRAAAGRAEASPSDGEMLRIRMALLAADPGQLDHLLEALVSSDADRFSVLREFLYHQHRRLEHPLWALLEDPRQANGRRFRAACALARFDPPRTDREQARWRPVARLIIDQQLAEIEQAPIAARIWNDALRPLRGVLLRPLSDVFRDTQRSELDRFYAATILGNYAAGAAGRLADLLVVAEPRQFEIIFSALAKHSDAAERLAALPSRDSGSTGEDEVPAQEARRAIARLRLGDPSRYWQLLRRSDRPSARTHAIHLSGPLHVPVEKLITRLQHEDDPGVQQAILLVLGDVEIDAARRSVLESVQRLFAEHPDPGVHATAEWVLRTWGEGAAADAAVARMADGRITPGRRWYVSRHQRLTMAVHGPAEFRMGTPHGDPLELPHEEPHRRSIPRRFAIAATEVTMRQFDEFFREQFGLGFREAVQRNARGDWQHAASDDCPVGYVDWELAARYCNWMSQQEGIPSDQWCYRDVERRMTFADGYLERTGYRLPTEAEWEYACRAGTNTARFIGDEERYLPRYAWYMDSSNWQLWPVATLRPNDAGLFDVMGNVLEWCNDRFESYPQGQSMDDGQAAPSDDITRLERVSRGGSISSPARFVRSATRDHRQPATVNPNVGFRVARTLEAGSP